MLFGFSPGHYTLPYMSFTEGGKEEVKKKRRKRGWEDKTEGREEDGGQTLRLSLSRT